jgi:hypothetical protein
MVRRQESSARRAILYAVFVGVTFGLAFSIVAVTRKSQNEGSLGLGDRSIEGLPSLRQVMEISQLVAYMHH